MLVSPSRTEELRCYHKYLNWQREDIWYAHGYEVQEKPVPQWLQDQLKFWDEFLPKLKHKINTHDYSKEDRIYKLLTKTGWHEQH